MNFYKLLIQYRGTNYHGFQIQNDQQTIQGELNKAIEKISKSNNVKSIGSGRTDSGVHANAQVVRIEMPLKMPAEKIMYALNSQLPDDIRVLESSECDESFHPIFSAKSKEYRYYFETNEIPSATLNGLVTHFPFELNFELMNEACSIFLGKHDFINYQCTGTDVDSTVREIYSAKIIKVSEDNVAPFQNKNLYCFQVVGSGFLKQMVRLMMGALWNIGREKISLQDLKNSLEIQRSDRYGAVAPPDGLYLHRVFY